MSMDFIPAYHQTEWKEPSGFNISVPLSASYAEMKCTLIQYFPAMRKSPLSCIHLVSALASKAQPDQRKMTVIVPLLWPLVYSTLDYVIAWSDPSQEVIVLSEDESDDPPAFLSKRTQVVQEAHEPVTTALCNSAKALIRTNDAFNSVEGYTKRKERSFGNQGISVAGSSKRTRLASAENSCGQTDDGNESAIVIEDPDDDLESPNDGSNEPAIIDATIARTYPWLQEITRYSQIEQWELKTGNRFYVPCELCVAAGGVLVCTRRYAWELLRKYRPNAIDDRVNQGKFPARPLCDAHPVRISVVTDSEDEDDSGDDDDDDDHDGSYSPHWWRTAGTPKPPCHIRRRVRAIEDMDKLGYPQK
ncbi:hypothetical protein K488DRAFT_86626 [Vararia minispora EC-137]|uniref:Uncharacterized protein n=1 Tax=Vararia minispora EC-137 TaxID=1314806 RepID=A0ACB8QIJ1_9AGAM|nr:hypothetical protein K488DRAFT_86626 [Vararia minispora EC-137]